MCVCVVPEVLVCGETLGAAAVADGDGHPGPQDEQEEEGDHQGQDQDLLHQAEVAERLGTCNARLQYSAMIGNGFGEWVSNFHDFK
jgi:hypothetical protein